MNPAPHQVPDLFLTTRWSLVLRARAGTTTEAHKALDDLCSAYWYPVYAYIRRTCASLSLSPASSAGRHTAGAE